MTISLSQVLDFRNETLENEIQKTSSFIVSEFDRILPIFELDHEVLLLEIQKSELEINGRIHLPFNAILKVYPLTGKAKNLLSGKLNQSIEIGEAIFEGIVEQVKLIRSIRNRRLLFNKLTKICSLKQKPSSAFCEKVDSIVEFLLKNQNAGNSYLANLIQYNYSPNEISSGNIEFLEKIGIIAWIKTKSSSEGYTNSNYYKRCEEFKSKINEGDYVTGYKTYLGIIEENSEFKISHDRIKEISNEGQIEIDLFKASYYFLAIKTKLNKNNSNLLDLFEDLIRDIYSDPLTMSHVLYLISYSFSFEQLYESVHVLERSALLKSKVILWDAETILNDLKNEEIKQIKAEEESIRIEKEKQLKAEEEERIRLLEEERLKTVAEERNRLIEEEQLIAEAEEKIRLEQEQQLKTEEEMELDAERIKMLIQSHTPVDDNESSSDSNLLENKNEEIEIGKTIELDPFNNSEKVNVQNWKDSDDSTKNENEGSDQQESSTEVSDPSLEHQNSDNHELINNRQKIEYEKSVDSNPSTIGAEEEELKINETNTTQLLDIPKKPKSSKKTLQKKNNEPSATNDTSQIPSQEENNIENQKQESNVEQNTIAEKRVITVQIFEDEFIFPNYKDNKEKYNLWDELMGEFFPIKTDSISLKSIINQINLRKVTKEGLVNTPEEKERIKNFFDQ